MEEIKLPIKSIVGAFFTGLGVVDVMTLFITGSKNILQYVGLVVAIVGIILLILDIKQYRTQRGKMSLERSVDKSKVVWGLWHTGAQVGEKHLLEKGTSIKRILLFDYRDTSKLINLVSKGEASGYEGNIKKQIQELTERALALKDEGVEVRWYSDPMDYSIVIFERVNDNVKTVDDFSDTAWLYGQFLLAKVRRDRRPPFLLEANSNHNDIQQSFKYYIKEYKRIWDKARPITSLEDMECAKI